MNKWLVLWLLLHYGQPAHALELYVQDFQEKTVAIAKQEVTLIAVKDDRIQQVRGVAEQYWLQTDDKTGTTLFRSLVQTPIQLFITTEKNHHYVLRLLPKRNKAEPLVLRQWVKNAAEKPKSVPRLKKSPYLLQLDKLHSQRTASKPQQLSKNLYRRYLGKAQHGKKIFSIYQLNNRSNSEATVEPSELLSLTKAKGVVLPRKSIPAHSHIIYYEVHQ